MAEDTGAARALMEGVARGETVAARTLFQRYGDTVYRYLRGCGSSPEDAEDLTQEVFMQALARAPSYAGRGTLEGWLLRIARTRTIDRARRERTRARREREWAESWQTEARRPRPSPQLLDRLLEALPAEDREVIVLAKFLGFPSARTAEVLGLTPGAARVRLHRALERLTERYQEVEAP